jgi:hypothetical protein
MNLSYIEKLPSHFSNESRVWIYQSNRPFTQSEKSSIQQQLNEFVSKWDSHGKRVKGFAQLFFGQFIVLMADITAAEVSGCSTDSSVRLIKSFETQFELDLFNRQQLAFSINDSILTIALSDFSSAVSSEQIKSDTLYFNNMVLNKNEFIEKWIIPVEESWLAGKLSTKI